MRKLDKRVVAAGTAYHASAGSKRKLKRVTHRAALKRDDLDLVALTTDSDDTGVVAVMLDGDDRSTEFFPDDSKRRLEAPDRVPLEALPPRN